MKDLKNRVKHIEKEIELNREMLPEMPDFNNWSDEQIDQYIVSETNKFHIENNIQSLADAKRIYDHYLEKNLISQNDYDLFMKAEKEFWDKASNSDSAVFFVE